MIWMLTIKDIAKKAGVSVATVSKVMNGYDDIGEVTILRFLLTSCNVGFFD